MIDPRFTYAEIHQTEEEPISQFPAVLVYAIAGLVLLAGAVL